MEDDTFWDIIELRGSSEHTLDESNMGIAVKALAACSEDEIKRFDAILIEKLEALNTPGNTAKFQVSDSSYVACDAYEYARCYVVSRGRVYYKKALTNSKLLLKNEGLESLKYLAAEAYSIKTGKDYWDAI